MLWLLVYAFELLVFTPPIWKLRKYVVPFLMACVACTSIYLAWHLPSGAGAFGLVLLALSAVFRLFNLARIIKARMHTHYLRHVTMRTALVLAFYHSVGYAALRLVKDVSGDIIALGVTMGVLMLAAIVLLVTAKNIMKLHFKMPERYLADRDLPTVTVAIPARNETADLEECLRAVLANDYPKLEILVLDDCSQDKTAEVIKSFAHAGVRFVKGDEPEQRWLAKNQAYEKLAKESNGELILFCGVDVRLGISSIRSMVNLLHSRKKRMLSVLPHRVAGTAGNTVIQPMRYWWELAIPRRFFNRPAVIGTCWLIDKAALKKLGGFRAVSHAIIPEGYFARELVKQDAYSFVRSSEELDVRTVKNVREQRSTALRVRYPQVRRRPETVLAITLVELLLFVAPICLLVLHLYTGMSTLALLAAAALACVLATHLMILQISNPANVAVAILTFPFSVLTELVVGYISMLKYEFGRMDWKDRNVCIPVMHVYSKLPPLPEKPTAS